MKKITKNLMIGLAISMLGTNAMAYTTNKAFSEVIKMKDIKGIDKIIVRENRLTELAEKYILETADVNPTPAKIKNYFSMYDYEFSNFLNKGQIDFSVKNNSVIEFTNVVSPNPAYFKIYVYSKKRLHTTTMVEVHNEENILVCINSLHPLSAKVIDFINKIQKLKNDYTISATTPTDKTKDWLKPLGDGGFIRYKFNNAFQRWIIIENNRKEIFIDSSLVPDIQKYNSVNGQFAYYKNQNNMLEEYVYINGKWYKTNGATATVPLEPTVQNFSVSANYDYIEISPNAWSPNKVLEMIDTFNCVNDLDHCGVNQDIKISCSIPGDYNSVNNCRAINYSCIDSLTNCNTF